MRQIGRPLWGPERGGHVSTVATWTEAGHRFLRTLRGHRLAIVDPLAAAFASSEIDRSLVRAFTSAIDGEAEAAGCTVLLIAHPSQAGAGRDGGGYSGSSDWQASVRAHLILEASDNTGHSFVEGNGKAQAWRLANPKQSYAPDGGHLWLMRHWRAADPEHNTPAELAWFGTRAGNAANAFERTAAKHAGKNPRGLSGPDAQKHFVPGMVPLTPQTGEAGKRGKHTGRWVGADQVPGRKPRPRVEGIA